MLHYGFAISLPAWRLNRSRDIRRIQDRLVASGRVQWLGDALEAELVSFSRPGESDPQGVDPLGLEDLQRAVQRVRGLFQADRPPYALPNALPADGLSPVAKVASRNPAKPGFAA
jgi:hypothetical protein